MMAKLAWDRTATAANSPLGQYQVHEWRGIWLELAGKGTLGFFPSKQAARDAAEAHFESEGAALPVSC